MRDIFCVFYVHRGVDKCVFWIEIGIHTCSCWMLTRQEVWIFSLCAFRAYICESCKAPVILLCLCCAQYAGAASNRFVFLQRTDLERSKMWENEKEKNEPTKWCKHKLISTATFAVFSLFLIPPHFFSRQLIFLVSYLLCWTIKSARIWMFHAHAIHSCMSHRIAWISVGKKVWNKMPNNIRMGQKWIFPHRHYTNSTVNVYIYYRFHGA